MAKHKFCGKNVFLSALNTVLSPLIHFSQLSRMAALTKPSVNATQALADRQQGSYVYLVLN